MKEIAGDEWTLGDLTGLSSKYFWTWVKTDTTGYYGHYYLARGKCIELKRGLWLYLGKCMWRNHQSAYQEHMKYVCNVIVKPFKVKTLCYTKRVREMHELAKYLLPPSMKGYSELAANWNVRDEEFTIIGIQLAIKDRLTKSMRDELDNHPEDYRSLTYEDCCDLLSAIKVKDERKRAAVQIKKINSARAASLSDSDKSVSILRKKKANTGVLRSKNPQKGRTTGTVVYIVIVCFARR